MKARRQALILEMIDREPLHSQELLARRLQQRGFEVTQATVSRDMAEAMSAMPAIFPLRAVNVGEQWTREMPLPAGGPLGTRGSGHVNATFRLDSIDRSGNFAFVSMHGEILPDATFDCPSRQPPHGSPARQDPDAARAAGTAPALHRS